MKSAEFLQWATAIHELDHHQRLLLSEALHRQSDEFNVLELIKASLIPKMRAHTVGVASCIAMAHYQWSATLLLQTLPQNLQCTHGHAARSSSRQIKMAGLYLAAMAQSQTVLPHFTVFPKRMKCIYSSRLKANGTWAESTLARGRACKPGPLTKTLLTAALKPVLDADALVVSDSNPTILPFARPNEGLSHEVVNLSSGQRINGLGTYYLNSSINNSCFSDY